MTASIVPSISDEQLAELEQAVEESMLYAVQIDTAKISGLIVRLRAAEDEREEMRAKVEALLVERAARDLEMKAQGIESVTYYVVSKRDQNLLRQHAADKRTEGKRLAAMLSNK
ncbi:hypothetical protein [Pseudomonas sp.]|uniref:hypothetical protein n=1 Tax=Pseudomonas sp. TaxID=306 RepID=UPI002584AD58|nr:hypothetical protein [Pseudomonas sp.]